MFVFPCILSISYLKHFLPNTDSHTHTTTESLSEASPGSGDSHPSEGTTSVSFRWMRKKRKFPTRLMMVSEMNTVWLSLSLTHRKVAVTNLAFIFHLHNCIPCTSSMHWYHWESTMSLTGYVNLPMPSNINVKIAKEQAEKHIHTHTHKTITYNSFFFKIHFSQLLYKRNI